MTALLLNYAHPLTAQQLEQASTLLGQQPELLDIETQIDRSRPLVEEVLRLVDAAGLDAAAWQTRALLLNPPALATLALALIAALHGRCGYFLPIMHIRPVPDALPPRYEVAEIVNLQQLREQARTRR